MEPRRHAARAGGALVDIHYLGLAIADPAVAVGGDLGGELAGRLGADGEDGGMHLDAAGDAEDRDGVADGVQNVARRAVAAGEENERGPAPAQCQRGGSRVGGGGDRRRPAGDGRQGEAGFSRSVAAHRAGAADQIDRRTGFDQPPQGPQRPAGRHRRRAQRPRPGERGVAVGAPEADAAAHPGDGVDDQADLPGHRPHGLFDR